MWLAMFIAFPFGGRHFFVLTLGKDLRNSIAYPIMPRFFVPSAILVGVDRQNRIEVDRAR
jgi:hypothetical protein